MGEIRCKAEVIGNGRCNQIYYHRGNHRAVNGLEWDGPDYPVRSHHPQLRIEKLPFTKRKVE